jgi:hypothetical protein
MQTYQPHQNTPQADNTVVLAMDSVPAIASQKLQTNTGLKSGE